MAPGSIPGRVTIFLFPQLLWRNWLARSTVNREVAGSSPVRSAIPNSGYCLYQSIDNIPQKVQFQIGVSYLWSELRQKLKWISGSKRVIAHPLL